MPLRLVIENATAEELARGVAAAEAVFESSGISCEDAMSGMLAVELWDMKGFPEDAEPSEEQDEGPPSGSRLSALPVKRAVPDGPRTRSFEPIGFWGSVPSNRR